MSSSSPSLALPSRPRQLHELPSPKGLPLLGHLLQLHPTSAHLQMERWAAELGTPYRVRMAHVEMLVWSDPELQQQVLRERPHRYRRGKRLRPVMAEMGIEGVFASEGEAWSPQRRLVMQALNATHFPGFFPQLRSITHRLYRRWHAAAARGEVLDMAHELMRYTVDVTCTLAFGEDPNTIEREGNRIQQHLALIFPMIMKRVLTPFSRWRWLKLPADRRLDRSLAVVHQHVRELIEKARRRMRDEPSDTPRNLLEAMLAQRDAPGSGFSDEVVSANVLTLLLAGEDTTANSLAWSLFYLSADPALQDRLHHEARAAFGADPVCQQYEGIRALDRFEAVASEALRLRPVAPLVALEPLQDVVLRDVAVPARTVIYFLTRPGMMDPRHFHEPQRYDPERWLRPRGSDDEQAARPHETRAFLQFGAGPRVCPGRHLAAVEMRLVLSMLMHSFRVELAGEPADIREVLALSMMPSHMPVRLHLK
jgi:cytochrome P450